MSNAKISELTQNDSKSQMTELTDSDLAGIQGGENWGRDVYLQWLAASFGYDTN
jgi:hypothetical protein